MLQTIRSGCTSSKRILEPATGDISILQMCFTKSCVPTLTPQVFAALRSDFSTRKRERCLRVDFAGGMVTGIDDLERTLRDAVKSTFEARTAAYDDEVRRRWWPLCVSIKATHCGHPIPWGSGSAAGADPVVFGDGNGLIQTSGGSS